MGTTENVWERLKIIGNAKFYIPEYGDDPSEMGFNAKRIKEKEYVEGKGKRFLIPTEIATTNYINEIIDKHVKNPEPSTIWETFKEWHYKKDWKNNSFIKGMALPPFFK